MLSAAPPFRTTRVTAAAAEASDELEREPRKHSKSILDLTGITVRKCGII